MFLKVVRRDPFMSFFEDDDDDLFSGVDQLADMAVPLSVSPFGVLAIRDPLANKRGKENQKKALKRKKSCGCYCRCQEEEATEKQEQEPQSSPTKQPNKDAVVESSSETLPPTKKTKFEMNLNLGSCYKPGELKVKLAPDNRSLIVEGCHEESRKSECGFSKVSSQMYQRIPLPKDVDVEGLKCDLNEKGVMCISAPRVLPALEDKEKVRQIPVNIAGDKKEENPAVERNKENASLTPEKEVQENKATEQVESSA